MISYSDRKMICDLALKLAWPIFDRNATDAEKPGCDSGPVPCLVENSSGMWFGLFKRGRWMSLADPMNDLLFAFEVQAAIAGKPKIRRKFTQALNREWSPDNPGLGRDWNMANATPTQRIKAAILALGDV